MSFEIPPTLKSQLKPGQDLTKITSRSSLEWECDKNHEWKATLHSRLSGTGCPVCSNRRVLKGFNDLMTVKPNIAAEWHPNKNRELTPDNVVSGSSLKAWWMCKEGHEWQARIENRIHKDSSCPYCANQKVFKGFNDLETLHPEIASQWHPDKNDEKLPSEFVPGTKTKVWWKCSSEHEWEASIVKRVKQNRGCPYCVNQKVLKGYNDLATLNPNLASEWHPTKNLELKADAITQGSNKKVWWLCKEGHEWEATVHTRNSGQRGCPYCVNQKILPGYNDFQNLHPLLASEWHPTKNGELKPEEVSSGTQRKVWWLGSCGHEWQASLSERTGSHKTGCPKCPTVSSKAEKEIADMIHTTFPELLIEYGVKNLINATELDIYIPEKKIAIEYNGLYWHSDRVREDKNYHYNKWKASQDAGIQLIQIWEDEWRDSKEIVARLIKHKLGLTTDDRIYARETYVADISMQEANKFLDDNHIQGKVNGSLRYGLRTKRDNKLVALMVCKVDTDKTNLNLIRYATSHHVIGGFTKLIAYFKNNKPYESLKTITTFSDNIVSDGALYSNNGFLHAADIKPDYMYLYKNNRCHKFTFRLKRFRNDPELKYQEGLTEKELAELNNIPRIWDAGKVKWIYNLD